MVSYSAYTVSRHSILLLGHCSCHSGNSGASTFYLFPLLLYSFTSFCWVYCVFLGRCGVSAKLIKIYRRGGVSMEVEFLRNDRAIRDFGFSFTKITDPEEKGRFHLLVEFRLWTHCLTFSYGNLLVKLR